MIIWNLKSITGILASCVWNLSEYLYIPLPAKLAPKIFEYIMTCKGKKEIK